ncbi:Hypothetical protein NTJ_04198 [Nesidiocoris tenuis]|nr:Hypothetical protein NTJ_04198 [Nesidiocoris tenuis]
MPLMPSQERPSSTTQAAATNSRTSQDSQQTTMDYTTEQPEDAPATSENLTEQEQQQLQQLNMPNKARLLSRNQQKNGPLTANNVPWSWARNIMLEKPVLKKAANL